MTTTMTTTLKIQLHDELHRITVNPDTFSLEDLKARVRIMFPQLDTFLLLAKDEAGDLTLIQSDLDLDLEFQRVASKSIFSSPILRIDVQPITTESEDVEDEPIPLEVEDELKEVTVLEDVEQAEAEAETETVEEEKTEEEKTEAEETTEVEQTDSSSSYTSLLYCSHCQEQILTFTGAAYYKCINCYDVAICELCESYGRHELEPSHLLVKLRVPFEELPPQQKLICLKHVHVARGDAKTKEAIKERLKAVRSELRQAQKSLNSVKKESRNAERRKRQRHRTMMRNILDKKEAKRVAAQKEASNSSIPYLTSSVAPTEEPAMQSIVNDEESPKESTEETEVVVEEPVQTTTEGIADTVNVQEVVEELPSLEDQQESWGVLNLMNSFKEITGLAAAQDPDHRIQGVAFRQKLDALEAMGFTDRNLNVFVLIKHLANVERAVEELVSSS